VRKRFAKGLKEIAALVADWSVDLLAPIPHGDGKTLFARGASVVIIIRITWVSSLLCGWRWGLGARDEVLCQGAKCGKIGSGVDPGGADVTCAEDPMLAVYIVYALLKFFEFFFRNEETKMRGLRTGVCRWRARH